MNRLKRSGTAFHLLWKSQIVFRLWDQSLPCALEHTMWHLGRLLYATLSWLEYGDGVCPTLSMDEHRLSSGRCDAYRLVFLMRHASLIGELHRLVLPDNGVDHIVSERNHPDY